MFADISDGIPATARRPSIADMFMNSPLLRTHVTSLTDDELILFDVLFEFSGSPCKFLRKLHFGEIFNYRAHSLDDDALDEALASLCERGLLRAFQLDGRPHCGMTSSGGALWEVERLPDWSRFAGGYSSGQNLNIETYYATSESVVTAYASAWIDASGAAADVKRLRRATVRRFRVGVNSWKPLPELSVICVAMIDRERETDLAMFESRRCWWRGIRDLLVDNRSLFTSIGA